MTATPSTLVAPNNPFSEADVAALLPSSGFLHDYFSFSSKRTQAHSGYHLACGLALLSQACPPTLHLPLARPIGAHLYVMLVGKSTDSGKSTSIGQATHIVDAVCPEQTLVQPDSRAALIDSVRAVGQCVVAYNEFGDFLTQTSERGSYLKPLKLAYTGIFDGMPIGRATVKKKDDQRPVGTVVPRLSILAGVAPTLLENHTEESDWTGGFLARFLTIAAEPEIIYETEPADDPFGRAAVVDAFRSLHWAHGGLSSDSLPWCGWRDEVTHRDNWLDPEGAEVWKAFGRSLRGPERNEEDPLVQAAISRADVIAQKVALLLAWDDGRARGAWGPTWWVDGELAQRATGVARLHVASVKALAKRIALTPDMRDRRRVLDACKAGEIVTLGEICLRSKLLKHRVQQVISTLIEERTVVVAGQGFARATVDGSPLARGVVTLGALAPMLPDAAPLEVPGALAALAGRFGK